MMQEGCERDQPHSPTLHVAACHSAHTTKGRTQALAHHQALTCGSMPDALLSPPALCYPPLPRALQRIYLAR
jgi:hypothetical protein